MNMQKLTCSNNDKNLFVFKKKKKDLFCKLIITGNAYKAICECSEDNSAQFKPESQLN